MADLGQGWRRVVLVVAVVGLAACGAPPPQAPPGSTLPSAIVGEPGPASTVVAAAPATVTAPTTVTRPPITSPSAPGSVLEVAYRLERRTADAATAGFEAVTEATLADSRGWARAGFRLVRRPTATFVVVLAEGPEVDARCLPYETYGLYSCQNGPVVALNADRWRTATPKWTGTLDDYRRYLVGHEVGHLLGLHHPRRQCPAPGQPAPLMAQQSTELNGCLPNPWPLEAEVQEGRRRPPDLAPPYRP